MDDITSINSDGVFAEYFNSIYPLSLDLNKENECNLSSCVLDLNIDILDGKFISRVYDKRDDFKFKVVQFQPCHANQARSVSYGVFRSQVIRYSRICNQYSNFRDKCKWLWHAFLDLGYDKTKLMNLYKRACRQHRFDEKYGRECGRVLE